jgi:hypothetical protein
MALETSALKRAIKSAFQDETVRASDAEASADKLAELLAKAMEDFVKSGEVSFTSGQITGTTPDVQTSTPVPLTAGAGTGGKVT